MNSRYWTTRLRRNSQAKYPQQARGATRVTYRVAWVIAEGLDSTNPATPTDGESQSGDPRAASEEAGGANPATRPHDR